MANRAKGYLACSECSKDQKSEAGTRFCQFCGNAYAEAQVEVARQEALRDDLVHKWPRVAFLSFFAFAFLVSSFFPSLARALLQGAGLMIFMVVMLVSSCAAYFLARYVAKKRFPIPTTNNPS